MSDAPLFCANHPSRPTTLRCNRCGKPICARCAMHTPVGYRCRECVRGQQAAFETAKGRDLIMAVVIAGVAVGLSIGILRFIGLWGFLLAPFAGGGSAEVVRWAVGRRRSRTLLRLAVAGGVLGVLPYLWLPGMLLAAALASGSGDISLLGGSAMGALFPIGFGLLIITAMYARLRGITF
jgi:hypothetical protein